MNIVLYFILSIFSGVLYRMGGSDKYNTKWRDLGVPFCAYLLLSVLYGFNIISMWNFWFAFVLSFISMTTYWKKGEDCYWYNWLITGLMYGLSFLPLMNILSIENIILRSVILAFGTMYWSEYQNNAVYEEFGRGLMFTSTIPLLMIGV